MKIVLAGGGTMGHVYPLLAVAAEIRSMAKKGQLIQPELYFVSDQPYDARALFELGIGFRKIYAGKVRRYFSLLNITDLFKTALGVVKALITLFDIYPDVVFAKGGFASFPVLFAARILRIPVVIHESDSKPGRVNEWAGKFAERIAISYPDAVNYFKKAATQNKVAWTGQPIRPEIALVAREGAKEFLDLEEGIPVILILGGSQGAQTINDLVLNTVSTLIADFQIIHQTGKANFEEAKRVAEVEIGLSPLKARYKPFDYLNLLALRMSAGIADLVISRAGSSIFEIAAWGTPSIIIPIPEGISHDQTKNAFNYARSGACIVIEENNLTAEVFLDGIKKIMNDPNLRQKMSESAHAFAKPGAARTIADAILEIGLSHEK